jgi:sterol desaturase/sphingolipid hydroxylase (fatty acid hydroxylase superfamily)
VTRIITRAGLGVLGLLVAVAVIANISTVAAKFFGLGIGIVGLFIFFGLIEHFFPAIKREKRRRKGVVADVIWFFVDPTVSKGVTTAAIVVVVVIIASIAGVHLDKDSINTFARRDSLISSQPALLQGIEVFVALDLIAYWSHRMFHRRALLWRYHSVHHSSTEVDWLSSVRVHPLNEAGTRVVQAIPLVLLGYNPTVIAGLVPLLTLYAIYLHANVPWSYGPLRYVIASPVFHRWHHTTELEGIDKDFAGMFPWMDAIFGTLYLPKDRQPMTFGILNEAVPDTFWGQLTYPFRRRPAAEEAIKAA